MWSVMLIQWLHILMGITWFGSVIFYHFVGLPAVMSFPLKEQGMLMGRLGKYTPRLVVPASILVILLGILRGTVFGPIQSLSVLFGTAYGITWMLALAGALFNFVEGVGIGKLAESLNKIEVDVYALEEGKVPTVLATRMQQIKKRTLVSLLVFFLIFTCMILMRFGF
jgi:uncharacterized membrane protein